MKRIILLLLIALPIWSQGQTTYLDWLQPRQFTTEYNAVLSQARTNLSATPTFAQQIAQDELIRDLQAAGIWSISDVFHVKQTNGSAAFSDINWVSPANNKSIRINNPVFTPNGGIQSDLSTTAYTDENWAPASGPNFTQNSCETVAYYDNIILNANYTDGCANTGITNATFLNPLRASTQANGASNSVGSGLVTDAQFDATAGLYFSGRTSSSSGFVRKGNNSRVTYSVTSATRTATTYKIGLLDSQGSLNNKNSRKCMMFWAGGLLTTTQETQFKAAWDKYMTSITSDPQNVLGNIYNQSTWSGLTDFTNNGSTVSVVSNKLSFSGGAGNFTQTLDLATWGSTCLEKWKITVLVKCNSKASSTGWGVGLHSKNSSTHFYDIAGWFQTNLSGVANAIITTGTNGTFTNRGNTAGIAFTTGDITEVIFERTGVSTFTITSWNVTTGTTPLTASYDLGMAVSLPNTSNFCIYSYGGNFVVQSLLIESAEKKNASYLFFGDSKTVGYNASKFANRYSAVVADRFKDGVVLGGAGDRSTEYLLRVNEIIALAPKIVFLMGATNDPPSGISSSTTISNMASIYSTLTTAGLKVVWTTGFYQTNGTNQTPLQNYILTNYSSDKYLDTLPIVLNVPDGIHGDDADQITIGNIFINSGLIVF